MNMREYLEAIVDNIDDEYSPEIDEENHKLTTTVEVEDCTFTWAIDMEWIHFAALCGVYAEQVAEVVSPGYTPSDKESFALFSGDLEQEIVGGWEKVND